MTVLPGCSSIKNLHKSSTIAKLASAKSHLQEGKIMNQEKEIMTFHNESAISRISLWANIVAYTILVFGLIGFAQQAYQLVTNWAQIAPSLPASFLERISIFVTNVFMDPLVSVFYFLALRGISQLLNLGLDLFYADVEEIDVEEATSEPEQEK
jgi:hypothetical protein